MAHNLEMENGEVAFALRGAPAWHNLANRIFTQDEEVTTATMLEEAKLANWNVRLSPITEHIPESWNDVSSASLVIRDNPFKKGVDVLATVGKRYKPVQNEELFAFADAIHDANADCRWESMPCTRVKLSGGRRGERVHVRQIISGSQRTLYEGGRRQSYAASAYGQCRLMSERARLSLW